MMKRSLTLLSILTVLAGCETTTTGSPTTGPVTSTIDFGNDTSTWAFDGECDDPRFQGIGMAVTSSLTNANIRRDATDCRALFNAGQIQFFNSGGIATAPTRPVAPSGPGFSFGNDTSQWAFDGECDDPRFQGIGMAVTASLTNSNIMRDATDCRNLYNSGQIQFFSASGISGGSTGGGINFGNDTSQWAFDGECDDPRFSGPGMAVAGSLTSANIRRDATDCRNLYNSGMVF